MRVRRWCCSIAVTRTRSSARGRSRHTSWAAAATRWPSQRTCAIRAHWGCSAAPSPRLGRAWTRSCTPQLHAWIRAVLTMARPSDAAPWETCEPRSRGTSTPSSSLRSCARRSCSRGARWSASFRSRRVTVVRLASGRAPCLQARPSRSCARSRASSARAASASTQSSATRSEVPPRPVNARLMTKRVPSRAPRPSSSRATRAT
mmetsp:Transcript_5933/g.18612  ORF Transcript_5933/g.18612 Transcript_5933/m.18612 type:complete len:204 (+) Transcript_5933:98-709(+)